MQSVVRNIKPSGSPQFFPATAEEEGVLTISATKSSGGILIPSGTEYVYPDENTMYSFTPYDNYEIDEVIIDGITHATAKANGYYTFSNVTKNHTIAVTFKTSSSNEIKDIITFQNIYIFPNPVKNEIFIKSELLIGKVEIYTLTGTLLKQEKNFIEKISVSALPQGIYLLKVYTDKGVSVNKIVKE
jgi:hypothetical protein